MSKILLDYVFPISVVSPTQAASTAFLKQVCIVVEPKNGVTPGTITLCDSAAEVEALTANTNHEQLFNAGMTRLFVLPAATLDIADALAANENEFFTVLISDDFASAAALDVGAFDGVVGMAFTSESDAADFVAANEMHCGFFGDDAENMFYAFGKLLSNSSNWLNNQFISMPNADGAETLGEAETLFDGKVSFVIQDEEFGNRLALFSVGGKAIVAPYILKNLRIDLQSRALNWISGNQPSYTLKEAALLETRLQEDVINLYINTKKWIADGIVSVTLQASNFVANGAINVSEPKALWRVISEMRQTL